VSVVSVINYKGGGGKTTLTANLGAELAARGRKVLLIEEHVAMTDPAELAQKVLGAVAAFVRALPADQLEDLANSAAKLELVPKGGRAAAAAKPLPQPPERLARCWSGSAVGRPASSTSTTSRSPRRSSSPSHGRCGQEQGDQGASDGRDRRLGGRSPSRLGRDRPDGPTG
jgi:hypothetical protein